MAPKLKVTSGPAEGQSFEIDRELIVGRENADLTIEDSELSRRHAAIRPVAAGVEIEDLGSMNGTFVNDRRVAEPVTLSLSGTVRVGTSRIAIDLPMPQTTKPSQIPSAAPDVTVARDVVPAPDATVAREVVKDPPPDAPAAPEPDVTAPRDVPAAPEPDVTAPRDVPPAPEPDVTAPRDVPPAPAPEAPAPPAKPARRRDAPVAQPGDVTAARDVPAAPPADAPGAPAQAPEGGPPSKAGGRPRGGPPLGAVLAGAAALIAIALIVIFLLAAFGPDAQTRDVNVSGQLRTVEQIQNKALSRGQMKGEPLGTGTIALDTVLGGPPDEILKGPTPFSGKASVTTPNGNLTAVLTGTAEPGPGGRGARSEGRVRFSGGTGDFYRAEGTGTFVDDRTGDARGRFGQLTVKGSFESESK